MSNKPDMDFDPVGASKSAIRREFANRLLWYMAEKGWNQSELARRANDAGSERVARDDISSYVRRHRLPGSMKARQIAAALDVALSDLIPSAKPGAHRDQPDLEMRSAGDGSVWLKLERRLPYATALKVLELLQNAENADKD